MSPKTQEPHDSYARQSRVRVRSATRAALICVAIAAAVAFAGWSPKIPLGIGAFFLVVAAIEYFNARYNEKRADKSRTG